MTNKSSDIDDCVNGGQSGGSSTPHRSGGTGVSLRSTLLRRIFGPQSPSGVGHGPFACFVIRISALGRVAYQEA